MRTLLASLVLFLPRTGFARRALAAFLADWRYEAERASSFLDRCLVDIRWTLAAGSNIARLLWCAVVSLGHERSVVPPVEVSGMSSRSTVRLSQWCTSVREHKVLVLVCTLLATGATVAAQLCNRSGIPLQG